MPRKKRCTYYEYRLLVSPKRRGRKMPVNLGEKFLDAIIASAAKLELEVVGGFYPRPTRIDGKGKSALQRHPNPTLVRAEPKTATNKKKDSAADLRLF
ncbi:MAG: hypothetical protein ABIJ96_04045 [Elusimicrobiota bacterium]